MVESLQLNSKVFLLWVYIVSGFIKDSKSLKRRCALTILGCARKYAVLREPISLRGGDCVSEHFYICKAFLVRMPISEAPFSGLVSINCIKSWPFQLVLH